MSFTYSSPFKFGEDSTKYRKLSDKFVKEVSFEGDTLLKVEPEAIELLTKEAFNEVSFFLREAHLKNLGKILEDPEASDNDRFVATTLLKNAVIAAKGDLPSCQDTGTAIVYAKKGDGVFTGKSDEEAMNKAIYQVFQERNLRYSQIAPVSMFEEKNTGNNLPAQIDIIANQGSEYKFLFVAKGGGSANKSYLFQKTKSLLNEENLTAFIKEQIKMLGTAACPPYHLAIVIGGTSAETTMKMVKLASCKFLDHLPTEGSVDGQAFRDLEWEQKVFEMTQKCQIGAQFGGKYFCHDVRVIRMSRHAASCPVGIGVSCSADRNILGKINKDGIFLEELDRDPGRFLPPENLEMTDPIEIDLNMPMAEVRKKLSQYPIKTRLSLTGTLIVARDSAHMKIAEMLDTGKPLPDYLKNHPVYYAGPAKKPEGMPSGSFGPTTANRMDPYVPRFMAAGGSLIMLAKGNRSPEITAACKEFGGFYLGSIGGPAAILAQDNIKKVELVDFEELGMEAVRKIEVVNFPAFIVTDDKGNDFFEEINRS